MTKKEYMKYYLHASMLTTQTLALLLDLYYVKHFHRKVLNLRIQSTLRLVQV